MLDHRSPYELRVEQPVSTSTQIGDDDASPHPPLGEGQLTAAYDGADTGRQVCPGEMLYPRAMYIVMYV